MITDKINSIDKYSNIPENIRKIIKQIPFDISCGRHPIQNDDYMNVETYDTKPFEAGVFESHKKYIDVQIILSGTERIDYVNIDCLDVGVPYNSEKDIIFYKKISRCTNSVILNQGEFAVFYPHEAHMPQLNAINEKCTVKKVVVKIKID